MKMTILALSALAFLAIPTIASADTVPPTAGTPAPAGDYSLTFNGGLYSGNALVTAESSGHVTNISGTVNDNGTLYDIVGVDGTYANADNNLYITPAYVTFAGLSFDLLNGSSGFALNLYNNLASLGGDAQYGLIDSVSNPGGYNTVNSTTVSVNLSAVPEPATWAMMLVGFGAIGFGLRRRRSDVRIAQLAEIERRKLDAFHRTLNVSGRYQAIGAALFFSTFNRLPKKVVRQGLGLLNYPGNGSSFSPQSNARDLVKLAKQWARISPKRKGPPFPWENSGL